MQTWASGVAPLCPRRYPDALDWEAVLGGEPAQQGDELFAFGGAQAGAEFRLVLGGGSHDFAQDAATFAGEMERPHAAVSWNRPPLDQAALLELVDEGDHAACRDLQRLRERLLRLSFRCGDVAQEHDGARIELERAIHGAGSLAAERAHGFFRVAHGRQLTMIDCHYGHLARDGRERGRSWTLGGR